LLTSSLNIIIKSMISKDFIIKGCQFVSDLLGPTSEVVLHNAKTGVIEWISEDSISHRKIGDINTTSILKYLNTKCEKKNTDRIVGVINTSESNTLIRKSNLMIRDDEGELQYVLCVNQDVTVFADFQPFLKHMFHENEKEEENIEDSDSADIEEIMTNIILEEVKNSDIYQFETKAAKMAVIARLSNRGVFKVKQAIPKVCEVLNIAPPTLYKYIKLIESGEE